MSNGIILNYSDSTRLNHKEIWPPGKTHGNLAPVKD